MAIHRFEIVDGQILKTDVTSGGVSGRLRPRGTSIVQILPLNDLLVIREDYYEFPFNKSNVYCIDQSFKPVWEAELPSGRDTYANPITANDGWLHCASWDGLSCTLDPNTGLIVKKLFTK